MITDRLILRTHKPGPSGTAERVTIEVFGNNGATQVAGGTDTLDFDFSLAALAALRSGQTLTPRVAMVMQCGQSSSTEYAGTVSISGTTVSLTPKTPAAWSANATVAASALVIPYGLSVVCDVT